LFQTTLYFENEQELGDFLTYISYHPNNDYISAYSVSDTSRAILFYSLHPDFFGRQLCLNEIIDELLTPFLSRSHYRGT
jgi:hypothetical protein